MKQNMKNKNKATKISIQMLFGQLMFMSKVNFTQSKTALFSVNASTKTTITVYKISLEKKTSRTSSLESVQVSAPHQSWLKIIAIPF